MLPYFNTSGPCIPSEHYMLPPERRLHHVLALIEARRYFTLHAGRQTGKTTSAMWLEDHLGGSGRWRALWLDMETARERAGRYEIANPIYAEVLPRSLTHTQQLQIANEPASYVRPDGALDLGALMADWQVFWRKDGTWRPTAFTTARPVRT